MKISNSVKAICSKTSISKYHCLDMITTRVSTQWYLDAVFNKVRLCVYLEGAIDRSTYSRSDGSDTNQIASIFSTSDVSRRLTQRFECRIELWTIVAAQLQSRVANFLHLNFFSYCQFPDFEKFACRIPIKRTKLDFHFEFHSISRLEKHEKTGPKIFQSVCCCQCWVNH